MILQKSSWVKFARGKYHYQIKGKLQCGSDKLEIYVLFEEHNPPKKERCKKCMDKLK